MFLRLLGVNVTLETKFSPNLNFLTSWEFDHDSRHTHFCRTILCCSLLLQKFLLIHISIIYLQSSQILELEMALGSCFNFYQFQVYYA